MINFMLLSGTQFLNKSINITYNLYSGVSLSCSDIGFSGSGNSSQIKDLTSTNKKLTFVINGYDSKDTFSLNYTGMKSCYRSGNTIYAEPDPASKSCSLSLIVTKYVIPPINSFVNLKVAHGIEWYGFSGNSGSVSPSSFNGFRITGLYASNYPELACKFSKAPKYSYITLNGYRYELSDRQNYTGDYGPYNYLKSKYNQTISVKIEAEW